MSDVLIRVDQPNPKSPSIQTSLKSSQLSQSERSIKMRFNPRGSRLDEPDTLTFSMSTPNNLSISNIDRESRFKHLGSKSDTFSPHPFRNRFFESPIDNSLDVHTVDQNLFQSSQNISCEALPTQYESLLQSVIPSDKTIVMPPRSSQEIKEPNFDLKPRKSILLNPLGQVNSVLKLKKSVTINNDVSVIEVENWKIFNVDTARDGDRPTCQAF